MKKDNDKHTACAHQTLIHEAIHAMTTMTDYVATRRRSDDEQRFDRLSLIPPDKPLLLRLAHEALASLPAQCQLPLPPLQRSLAVSAMTYHMMWKWLALVSPDEATHFQQQAEHTLTSLADALRLSPSRTRRHLHPF